MSSAEAPLAQAAFWELAGACTKTNQIFPKQTILSGMHSALSYLVQNIALPGLFVINFSPQGNGSVEMKHLIFKNLITFIYLCKYAAQLSNLQELMLSTQHQDPGVWAQVNRLDSKCL